MNHEEDALTPKVAAARAFQNLLRVISESHPLEIFFGAMAVLSFSAFAAGASLWALAKGITTLFAAVVR